MCGSSCYVCCCYHAFRAQLTKRLANGDEGRVLEGGNFNIRHDQQFD